MCVWASLAPGGRSGASVGLCFLPSFFSRTKDLSYLEVSKLCCYFCDDVIQQSTNTVVKSELFWSSIRLGNGSISFLGAEKGIFRRMNHMLLTFLSKNAGKACVAGDAPTNPWKM